MMTIYHFDMLHGSLFSGIGGFDLAAEWMGWKNAFHCEYNPFAQRILKHYWPNAATYTDIRETDFTLWRDRIDILTGGFPCQPYSTAGKRRGKDDERHLWPEMLRAIRQIAPRWIVGENVRGLISWSGGLVFEEVQADLEAAGYEVQPFVLPAASVGAPHRRDRVWFVAYATDVQWSSAGANGQQCGNRREAFSYTGGNDEQATSSHPHHPGNSIPGRGADAHRPAQGEEREREPQPRAGGPGSWRVTSDAPKPGIQGGFNSKNSRKTKKRKQSTRPEGAYTAADWAAFPTQPPVLPGNDGLSAPVAGYSKRQWYNEHIKAAGNAIVPQVALQIFKAIEAYENLNTTP